MRVTLLTTLLLACLLTGLWSCAKREVATTNYHEHTMQNFYLARKYESEGRYELAKERLLLAMASAKDGEMRQTLAQELDAVDKMIKTQR